MRPARAQLTRPLADWQTAAGRRLDSGFAVAGRRRRPRRRRRCPGGAAPHPVGADGPAACRRAGQSAALADGRAVSPAVTAARQRRPAGG